MPLADYGDRRAWATLHQYRHKYDKRGSMLVWESSLKLMSKRSIADLKIADRSPNYPVNYLLDGQQPSCLPGPKDHQDHDCSVDSKCADDTTVSGMHGGTQFMIRRVHPDRHSQSGSSCLLSGNQ